MRKLLKKNEMKLFSILILFDDQRLNSINLSNEIVNKNENLLLAG